MHPARVVSVVTAVTATLALVPASAPAQVEPLTRFGGGELVDKPAGRHFTGRSGDANVSLLTRNDGAAVFATAAVLHACGSVSGQAIGSGESRLGPDGSFTVRSTDRSGSGRNRLTFTVTIAGKIEGDRVTGTIVSRTTRRGRRVCGGRTTFVAVSGGPASGAPAATPPAGAVLRGIVAPGAETLYEIVLRTSADGRSITRANVALPYNCQRPGTRRQQGSQVFYERGGAINPDGSFSLSDTYSQRWKQGLERGRVTITGRFVDGGIIGTVEMTSSTRRGGRTYDRCRSGRQPFSAKP
jgi:hypothetical protein